MTHEMAIHDARLANRQHSLILSRRFWQKIASSQGIAAWGYAYENGQFTKGNQLSFSNWYGAQPDMR